MLQLRQPPVINSAIWPSDIDHWKGSASILRRSFISAHFGAKHPFKSNLIEYNFKRWSKTMAPLPCYCVLSITIHLFVVHIYWILNTTTTINSETKQAFWTTFPSIEILKVNVIFSTIPCLPKRKGSFKPDVTYDSSCQTCFDQREQLTCLLKMWPSWGSCGYVVPCAQECLISKCQTESWKRSKRGFRSHTGLWELSV